LKGARRLAATWLPSFSATLLSLFAVAACCICLADLKPERLRRCFARLDPRQTDAAGADIDKDTL
jgi:hypothetical protein